MLERALNRIMLMVIASRFPETETITLKTEKCHNIGCLYSISGFLMALTAALKAQIAARYKALQEQIPTLFPVAAAADDCGRRQNAYRRRRAASGD